LLSWIDDTLHHQVPHPFEFLGTSDHRFYDRLWFGPFSNDGHYMMYVTLGVYKNMNVLDGGACVLDTNTGRQYNLRVSRELRPDIAHMGAGPFHIEMIEPLVSHRMVLEANELAFRFDLTFEAAGPPHEESQYVQRLDGRLVQDYHRFDQLGTASGWIEIDGQKVDVRPEQWSCVRDHSWGLRYAHSGGYEPVTSDAGRRQLKYGLHNWMLLRGSDFTCWVLFDKGDGVTGDRFDSSYIDLSGPTPQESRLRSIDYDLTVGPDDYRVVRGSYRLTLADGTIRDVMVEALKPPYTTAASGAYGGYRDGRGLGVHRGLLHVESEMWDISDPVAGVRDLDGTLLGISLADGPARVHESDHAGYGHLSSFVFGGYPTSGSAA